MSILGLFLPVAGMAMMTNDFGRYQVILDRAPFGVVQEPPTASNTVPGPDQGPSFVKDWHLVGVTESGGELQAALVNIQNNNCYLLLTGDVVEEVTVLAIDFERESVQLQKGTEKQWLGMEDLTMGGTNPGGITSVGSADGATSNPDRAAMSRRASRRRETSRHREVEQPTLTGAELEKHLQDYQMDLIRKGEPPLPIPLTKEMDSQLVKEGVLPPLK